MPYEQLTEQNKTIVDMTVFMDEALMRSVPRHGIVALSPDLNTRIGQLREIYACDLQAETPRFITWKDSNEAMIQRLATQVVSLQSHVNDPRARLRMNRLVELLENLPYPDHLGKGCSQAR